MTVKVLRLYFLIHTKRGHVCETLYVSWVSLTRQVSSVWPWPYFSTCFFLIFSFFLPPLLQISLNVEAGRMKGKGSTWAKEAYLHVSTSIQTEGPGAKGGVLVHSSFQIADWLPSVSAQEPGSRLLQTFLPLMQLMKHSCVPVFSSTWHMQKKKKRKKNRSKPQQCVVVRSSVFLVRAMLSDCFSSSTLSINGPTPCLFTVIRAKVVGGEEVDVGNDIYGNPIKRIKYGIKQIKVCRSRSHRRVGVHACSM